MLDERGVVVERGRGTLERRVTEREHAAVLAEQPVAAGPVGVAAMATIGDRRPDHRAVEVGVAEREHTTVGADQPVTVAGGRRGDADDRRGERLAADRTPEPGVAEGEHATVGGRDPVAAPARRGGETDEAGVEVHAGRRTERRRTADRTHGVGQRIVDRARRGTRARQHRTAREEHRKRGADQGDRRNGCATGFARDCCGKIRAMSR